MQQANWQEADFNELNKQMLEMAATIKRLEAWKAAEETNARHWPDAPIVNDAGTLTVVKAKLQHENQSPYQWENAVVNGEKQGKRLMFDDAVLAEKAAAFFQSAWERGFDAGVSSTDDSQKINHKLSSAEIAGMRKRRASGETLQSIAADFGVSHPAVYYHCKDIKIPGQTRS